MKLHNLKHTCIIPVLCAALLIPSYTVHADWEYNAEENTLRYKTKDGTYLTSVFRKIKGYTYYFNAGWTTTMSMSTKTVPAWQSAKNTKRNLSRPPRARNTGMWMAPTLQRLGRASKDTGTTFIRPDTWQQMPSLASITSIRAAIWSKIRS